MKLHDSKHHSPEVDNEIFVEGLSAAANVRRGRDTNAQAILALQGKPVNAAKASRSHVQKHIELQALQSAIGCGTSAELDLEATRYSVLYCCLIQTPTVSIAVHWYKFACIVICRN